MEKHSRHSVVALVLFGVLFVSAPALCQTAHSEVEPALDAGERTDLFWQRQQIVTFLAARRQGHITVSWSDVSNNPAWVKVTRSPSFGWLGKFWNEDGSLQFNAALESVPGNTQKVERCFSRSGVPMSGQISAVISRPPDFDQEILIKVNLDPATGCGILDLQDLQNPVIVNQDHREAQK